jgi:hypothetical protein
MTENRRQARARADDNADDSPPPTAPVPTGSQRKSKPEEQGSVLLGVK